MAKTQLGWGLVMGHGCRIAVGTVGDLDGARLLTLTGTGFAFTEAGRGGEINP